MSIEEYINENLSSEAKQTALSFVDYLRANNLTFYKDNCDCWKNKIYYWVKFGEECVCFIAIKDPDEPQNLWTIWSDESDLYENYTVTDDIRNTAWKYVDHCGDCGSCGGGKQKIIFGKTFDKVCGCTFRIDNPKSYDLSFLKIMIDLRIKEILGKKGN